MAIICTNYLTGNDSTGTGATAAPYKTIMKALAGATSGDEIRAAGGQWVPIGGGTGTFTFTNGSNAIMTSQNFSGSFSAGDIISFDDGEFGFDKFHIKIGTVSAAQINIDTAYWPGKTVTVNTVYKLDAYHYNQVTNPEVFNNANYLPNGRTGIEISGGWDSGYESNANGWTVFRNTSGSNNGLFNSASAPGMGRWEDNLVLDKFMMAQGSLVQGVAGTTAPQGVSFAIRNVALLTNSNSKLVNGTSATALAAIWNPSGEDTNIYIFGNVQFSGIINSPAYEDAYGAAGLSPAEWDVNFWASPTLGSTTPNALNSPAILPYSVSFSGSGSIIKYKNVYWRSSNLTSTSGFSAVIGNISSWPFYIENLELYASQPIVYRFSNPGQTAKYSGQIFGIGLTGDAASKSGITYGSQSSQTLIELNSYTIESTSPSLGSSNGATGLGLSFETSLSKVCESYLAPMQVKDTEGYKTLDINNNVYFKDPVNDWLRIKPAKFCSPSGATGGVGSWSVLGVLEKPTQPFVVEVSLKVNEGTWNSIGVQYGPLASQVYTQAISPTTSFATYTLTVDPATIPDWNSSIYPMFIGINSNMPNSFYEEADIYCYVNSLTIV